MLTESERTAYQHQGFIRIPGLFTDHLPELRRELAAIIANWAAIGSGWRSPDQGAASTLAIMHHLEYYSPAWWRACAHPPFVDVVQQLLGDAVEYLSSSTHAKPAGSGCAFPMHQDSLYYDFQDERALICMLHLDDTTPENGALHIQPGAWEQGHIPHTCETDPEQGGSYLDPERFPIEAAEPQYCRAGDVLIFNTHTIHGSPANRSPADRRAVVFRYRHPANDYLPQTRNFQHEGDRFGHMLRGIRPPRPGLCAPAGGDLHHPREREDQS